MMQANELRTGNWIQEQSGRYIKAGYHEIRLLVIGECVDGKPPSYKPIPLTPELLEKCGFKNVQQYGEDFMYSTDEWDILLSKRAYFFVWPAVFHGDIEIYNLHQLQNLIYALTGQELEINL